MIKMDMVYVLKHNWNSVKWWKDDVYAYVRKRLALAAHTPYYKLYSESGTNFVEGDWDNLIILDACRFDMYESLNTIDGDLQKRISVGSSTKEFLKKTFVDDKYEEIVYVTSNPQVALRLNEDIFHDVIHVWNSDWDHENETVSPARMVTKTIEAQKKYPNKRIISHFMQPHYPFIGPYAREKLENQSGAGLSKSIASGERAQRNGKAIWDLLRDEEVDQETVWKAYCENLEVCLPYADRLTTFLDGKSVITSDHGNLMGESAGPLPLKFYGHPTGIRTENLNCVPWHVIDSQQRRDITNRQKDDTNNSNEVDEKVVQERLESLGYR